jgi:hypothetical protein
MQIKTTLCMNYAEKLSLLCLSVRLGQILLFLEEKYFVFLLVVDFLMGEQEEALKIQKCIFFL